VEKLRKRQKAKILIVEGEKTCEAAQRLFPDMICLSWRGGTGNVSYVDWSPLKDRNVIIWPDNDEHGILAAQHISNSIPNAIIIEPPKWKPSGWDLADAEKEHIPKEKLYEYIANGTTAHSVTFPLPALLPEPRSRGFAALHRPSRKLLDSALAIATSLLGYSGYCSC
jgi:5S rRNA maturation endonuclease (ribonuclease M5)